MKSKRVSTEPEKSVLPAGYPAFLADLKNRISSARVKAALAVNTELVALYWEIGRQILTRQKKEGWGTGDIGRLAVDLKRTFPDMKGFSPRNLLYMKQFAEAHADCHISQQLVAKLPWGHNVLLIDRLDSNDARLWYAQKTLENGWSRNVLAMQIESNLLERQGKIKKTTNFPVRLPKPQSDLAEEALKDPYVFDFLAMTGKMHELDIEKTLVKHITDFLLELGAGFAFVGRQYPLEVSGEDFYIDLLFYHTKLHCYVAIELKTGDFKPEYAGKINFYLSALDDLVKAPADNPSIGIILCAGKNKILAEYALRDMAKPIGISSYQFTRSLPKEFKPSLPTIAELEKELGGSKK